MIEEQLIINYGLAGFLIAYLVWDRKTIMQKILEVIDRNNQIIGKNTAVIERALKKLERCN